MSGSDARIVPPVPSIDGAGSSPRPRAVILPHWPARNLDMRVLVDPAGALFSALDLARALNLTITEVYDDAGKLARRTYPEPFIGLGHDIPGHEVTAGFAERWLSADDVEALAARTGGAYARDLTIWAHDIVMQHRGLGLVDAAPKLVGAAEIAEDYTGTFDMRQAARELSTRLGTEYGRTRLFERLGALGWIERRSDIWTPTDDARRDGLLVVKPNHHVPGRGPYPQIRVTSAGLDRIAAALAPKHDPTLLDDLS